MKILHAVMIAAPVALMAAGCAGCGENGNNGNPADAGADATITDSGGDTSVGDSGGDAGMSDSGNDTATGDAGADMATTDSGGDVATGDTGDETTPSDIVGLILHLEANEGVTTSGDNVSGWADGSGNGNDFTQDEAAYQPTLVASAVNGLPAVEFNGEDQQLGRADSLGLMDEDDRTVVVVGGLNSLEARMPFFMQGIPGSTGESSSYFGLEANTFNTVGERFGFYLVSHAFDTEVSTTMDFNVHVLRTGGFPDISAMEQGSAYFLNGQELAFSQTPNNATNSTFASTATAIGGFPVEGAPSAVLDGQIAEVIVYEGTLSDDDVNALNAYLMNKYAIQ